MVWAADQLEVPWKYSNARLTTVASDVLARMSSPYTTTRLLAHAECTQHQIDILYRNSGTINSWGRKRRRTGIIIRELSLASFCEGLSERNICLALSLYAVRVERDRNAAIEALLRKA